MQSRATYVVLGISLAGVLLAGCDTDIRETKAEKRYVKICTQYIADRLNNADALCRCQWKAIKAKVPPKDMDEFFFKITAGRRFDTKASKLIDQVTEQCMKETGADE